MTPTLRWLTICTPDNPRGVHKELWFHEQGDRSWLVVTRDTLTHEILGAELANPARGATS